MIKGHGLTLALAITLSTGNLAPSFADVYVKVDAQGNAIGGAIMCDAVTCAAGSLYSQLTLQAGEQYVLQGTGDSGIGNNNPNTAVKVDIPTQTWTVTNTETQQVQKVFTPTQDLTPQVIPATPIAVIETITVMSDTSTVKIETITATVETITATVETSTAFILNNMPVDYTAPDWWDRFLIWITAYIEPVFGKVNNDD